MMEMTVDLMDYEADAVEHKRTAARGIIKDGERFLLIFSKHGDYKFPGGGREDGETLEENLIREVQEETGYLVIPESIKPYGMVLEKRRGQEAHHMLVMDSHYFFCDVEEKAGKRNLDEYEAEYDYQIVWITLEEAIKKNKEVVNLNPCPWVTREIRVMEALVKEK